MLLLCLVGCATNKVDWQSRVGNYTYDQAVMELGPADKLATLTDGTKVGEWLTYRGYSHGGVTTFGGPYYYSSPFIYHYADPPMPDRYLRLTFGPDGVLRNSQSVAK